VIGRQTDDNPAERTTWDEAEDNQGLVSPEDANKPNGKDRDEGK
jgi:hypothetical protein